MKRSLSLKKYLSSALMWLCPFVGLELLMVVLRLAKAAEASQFAWITLANIALLLLPGGYYLALFLLFKKKSEGITPTDGVIVNWEAGFFRFTGRVILQADGTEYATSAYFDQNEAKEMVGKTVSYAVIDDTLFLFEIKD